MDKLQNFFDEFERENHTLKGLWVLIKNIHYVVIALFLVYLLAFLISIPLFFFAFSQS